MKKIDALHTSYNYQPLKFNQFDGKGNPKENMTHFIKTCNNASMNEERLVEQFIQTLKGIAFDWYADLQPESIDGQKQIEQEFLNKFNNTQHVISIIELTNTRQWKDKRVLNYINYWRTHSPQCRDCLSGVSTVKMCAQGKGLDLLHVL